MSQNQELATFVGTALVKGEPRNRIEGILLAAGWSKRQAGEALASYAEVDFPIPVPRPRPYTDAREAFLYGLLFLSLYISALNFGGLLFALIDRAYPGGVSAVLTREAIRWTTSLLVVAVPVFLYMSWMIAREVRIDPSRRASEIRTKLTYLTLFISAAVVIGVLAGVVYNFLGGGLTIRFVLKALVATAIAAAVFAYYLRDMRTGSGT